MRRPWSIRNTRKLVGMSTSDDDMIDTHRLYQYEIEKAFDWAGKLHEDKSLRIDSKSQLRSFS